MSRSQGVMGGVGGKSRDLRKISNVLQGYMAGEKIGQVSLDKLLKQDKLLWVKMTQQNLEV